MTDRSDVKKKLNVLIPHWIKHNKEHTKEFQGGPIKAGMVHMDLTVATEHVSNQLSTRSRSGTPGRVTAAQL